MELQYTYPNTHGRFYKSCAPAPVLAPELLLYNNTLADEIGLLEDLSDDQEALAKIFSGNRLLPGTAPVALAYAGHQFGHFVPRLGDGRAHLLGEYVATDGRRYDIQLKGSGPTPFSRGGDGRCALGPALREYLMGESLYYLGVPTTRSIAVVTTGEPVFRDRPMQGAIVTRLAPSHIRIGSFEYCATKGDVTSIKRLADYTIKRHYPEIEGDKPYIQFFESFIEKQINLVTHWLRVGFIHGVMNTDNILLSGHTIDYGPCAMMGAYNPATSFSSIDHQGRYAFGNQAHISQWNIAQLGMAMLPLFHEDEKKALRILKPIIEGLKERFDNAYWEMMRKKFGFTDGADHKPFMQKVLATMLEKKLDYTTTFRGLRTTLVEEDNSNYLEMLGEDFNEWKSLVDVKKARKVMNRVNPTLIARNHQIEKIIKEAEEGNMKRAKRFLTALQTPYNKKSSTAFLGTNPEFDESYKTFCGT